MDISKTGGNGIARSSVRTNGLALHEVTTLDPTEAPFNDNTESTSDNDFERLCRKAKCGAKVKLKNYDGLQS